ncbi:ABC transporter permease [Rhodocytophaga aerolata]|uniref:ABC transporter permease n=1 Tax=Rhodocytophaga aerolata TaxID=455078 RepID=A0ABT8R741_9BACT|nr:ABC transporter permease [Rhodocytophaga aerolata]MDO1447921.1 ABC transporter permease [Rhodocytophaga aerolata]
MKNLNHPPPWLDKFLQWRMPEEQFEEVQGDMHELYGQWVEEMGEGKARRRYLWTTLTFLRPLPKAKKSLYPTYSDYSQANFFDMIRNYFKIAYRNLIRHKSFSFLNILGLTLGLTACLLIALFVRDEKSFDTFIPEGDRIYRIYLQVTNNEGTNNSAGTPPRFATTLPQEFPEVEKALRLLKLQSKDLFEAGDKKIYEEGGIAVDSTFFDFFPLSFAYGTTTGIFDDPTSIIISKEMAERYFGKENPIGKQISRNKTPFQVKGVFENNPKFHLQLTYILPLRITGIPQERMQSWGWQQFNTYVKLKPNATISSLETKFQDYIRENVHPILKESSFTYLPRFQPLHNVHLYSSDFKFDNLAVRGNITYVNALTIIALFILLIACFNFVNLATAKSLQRAKEVGVRKTVGATRKQLIIQYISETVLLAFISMSISVILTFLIVPWLNRFTEKQITFDLFTNPLLLPLLLILTIGVGVLAGFYPALVLSGFQPVKVLKGAGMADSKPGQIPWLRHSLVVVQFSLSVLLIVSAMVVIRQVNYLHNKDLGINKEQILFFPMRGDNMFNNYETFKNELLKSSTVSSVSIGYGFPGDMVAGDNIITSKEGKRVSQRAIQLMVDHDYVKTLDIQLIAGRDFSKQMSTDKDAAYIINETAVRELGFGTPDNALGKTLWWEVWGAENSDSLKQGQVIGVVKDFHYNSLYDKVETTVLQIFPDAYWKVAVKLKTAQMATALPHVQAVWNKFSPDYPIEYRFLDESFEQMYKAEDKLKSLLWIFTCITVFVACLGLFGLAAYAAERRKKEIGIRKVLGASVESLVLLLSKEFVKLVAVALLLATPLAWYAMDNWLQDFAYRIDLDWWIFALAGVLALLIALLTVSFQSIKAALMNPVKSLRSE